MTSLYPLACPLAVLIALSAACDSTPDAASALAVSEVDVRGDDTSLALDSIEAPDSGALDSTSPDTFATLADAETAPDPTETIAPTDIALDIDIDIALDIAPPPIPCLSDDDCDPGLLCSDNVCACDPTPVSFAADLVPLFKSTCGTSCHILSSATGGSAGLNLNTNFAFAELVAKDASQCRGANADRLRVVAGDIGGSYLMDKLLGRRMCSGTRMPKGRSAYSGAQLSLVGRWICQGAPKN